MSKRSALILIVLLLSASPAAASGFTLSGVGPAAAGIDAGLGGISLAAAGPRLQIYPLPPTLGPLLPRWRSALRDALRRADIFRGGPRERLFLSVRIMEFALTGRTLTVFARYQLDRPNSAIPYFRSDVMTDAGATSIPSGIAAIDYSARATRDRRQVDRAVRGNIAEFLGQLEAFAARQQIVTARAGSGPSVKSGSRAGSPAASRF